MTGSLRRDHSTVTGLTAMSSSHQNGKIGKGSPGVRKTELCKQFTATVRDDPLPLPRPARAASADFVRMRRHSMVPAESVVVSTVEPDEEKRFRRRGSMPSNGNFDDSSKINNSDNNNDFDPRGNRIQKFITKQESEAKLRSSLASLSDYNDGSEKIQRLRDRFSQSRRSLTMGSPRSLSGSRRALVSGGRKSTGGRGQKLKGSDTASQETPKLPRAKSDDDISVDQNSSTGPRRSTKSIPIKRVSRQATTRRRKYGMQREQMIESLAWFSFHAPRSVLEDLTAHELELRDKHRNHHCRMEDVSKASSDVCISLNLSDDVPDDGSLSSLSDEDIDESTAIESTCRSNDGTRSESLFMHQPGLSKSIMALPKSVARDCALLFVDITGFTKLSTLLDVESLSKVINYYFDLIISEVVRHGGDILKFAGDAFFAEWRATDNEESKRQSNDALANLNSSLAQSTRVKLGDAPSNTSRLASCVSAAAKCASEIVKKYSDFHVTSSRDVSISFGGENHSRNEAMLNVHCGIGVGHLVGLHVGDDREGRDEDAVEMRREYLFLGDPIEQACTSAELAADGQVMASPCALRLLARNFPDDIPKKLLLSNCPGCISSRDESILPKDPQPAVSDSPSSEREQSAYDDLRQKCGELSTSVLSRLHLQLALYVHPVVRGDELALSYSMIGGKTTICSDAPKRHRAEAELRSVFTMFIKAMVVPKVTGNPTLDNELYKTLGDIMHVTSRELDRYSGHLRQFIVDDKGVVLIATFGLRGSTFPNMVANNALPATFAIHAALKSELKVDNRIGATFGKVYCGVVGGVRRHEFAVMGAPVNLAARLMDSKRNLGILVDEAVKAQADARFAFRTLQPVRAKGYDKPVAILQPLHAVAAKKKGISIPFIGRQAEIEELTDIATIVLDQESKATVFMVGESGMGKTALVSSFLDEIRKHCLLSRKSLVASRCSNSETAQRVPLSLFGKMLKVAIHSLCVHDGTLPSTEDKLRAQKVLPRVDPMRPTSQAQRAVQKFELVRQRSPPRVRRGLQPPPRSGSSDSLISCPGAVVVPYFQKLCWACERLNAPYEYADIIGSQFLGMEGASPVTSVDGHVPTVDELVEFLVNVYTCVTDFADLVVNFVDDFQWIDTFSWKIIRSLCQRGKRMMFVCAMRSHDKQALRRKSSAASRQIQSGSQMIELTLGPLDFQDVRRIISCVLGHAESSINDSFCADIFQQTGGLPVYVIELLENIKRNNSVSLCSEGVLQWAEQSGKGRTGLPSNSVAVMEETFLNRFDALDPRVRKVLQTCAVLGFSFALSDIIRVHSELGEADIEQALDTSVDEMILVEEIEDDDQDSVSLDSTIGTAEDSFDRGENCSDDRKSPDDRFFQFSHAMWRNSVLKTMLKERKIELHRGIAQALEQDQAVIMQRSDIARLLTLFDHWKSCGDFCKAAPLAIAVGTRLEDWDLSAQSIDLYKEALDMCFESADNVDRSEGIRDEKEPWLLASAQPEALDWILRLHIKIGQCHSRLGEQAQCAVLFQDAFTILNTSPEAARASRSLMIPVLYGLCSVAIDSHLALESIESIAEKETLVNRFVFEANENGDPVHVCRALALEATFFAQLGNFHRALESQEQLQSVYDIEAHSRRMVSEYGKDFAGKTISDSVQWYYLTGDAEKAAAQADLVIQEYIPLLDPRDLSNVMEMALPVLLVLKCMGKAFLADYILKTYIINPFHEHTSHNSNSTIWLQLFNPMAYLLEIVKMNDGQSYDNQMLEEIEEWVLDDENSSLSHALEYQGKLLMGEICWQLAKLKRVGDLTREPLLIKGRELLDPIVLAKDQAGAFLVYSAKRVLQEISRFEGSQKENSIDSVDGKYHQSPDTVRFPLTKSDVVCK